MEIAILIATYNGGKYLEDLFVSLEEQTYNNFVCYIHDDGSVDNTGEIIQKYIERAILNIIVLEYPPTGSAKINFMSMLDYIDEPYVMFCDQDDVWLCDKIELTYSEIKRIETEGQPALVFTDLQVVDESLKSISCSFMKYTGLDPTKRKFNELLMHNFAPGCTMIANKALYKIAKQTMDYEGIYMHDWWFILIASSVGKISYIDQPTILYRQHKDNTVGAMKMSSTWQKILKGFTIVLSGLNYKNVYYKNLIMPAQKQAAALCKLPEIPYSEKHLCKEFCELNDKSKKDRVLFYIRNKLYRGSYLPWFLLWC